MTWLLITKYDFRFLTFFNLKKKKGKNHILIQLVKLAVANKAAVSLR